MTLYNAAVFTGNSQVGSKYYNELDDNKKYLSKSSSNILESYYYLRAVRKTMSLKKSGQIVFLDSGAYSAYTQGVEIDLDEYCSYIRNNQSYIRHEDGIIMASVLDKIGDFKSTYQNQNDMEKRGVCPLPCFHYGEPPSLLQYYARNYGYITIGGMVSISKPQLKIWLDWIWSSFLLNEDGSPVCRVHGFGLTALELLLRYPWHSVDSSSWIQTARLCKAVFFFNKKVVSFSLSDRVESKKDTKGPHFDNLSEEEKEPFLEIIKNRGFIYEDLININEHRGLFNRLTYDEVGAYCSQHPPQFSAYQKNVFKGI